MDPGEWRSNQGRTDYKYIHIEGQPKVIEA